MAHIVTFMGFLTKSNNTCRTHKGEIQMIEKKHQIFPFAVIKVWFLELPVDDVCTLKIVLALGGGRSVV